MSDLDDNNSFNCSNPSEIDIREKENKLKWTATGNIMLYHMDGAWISFPEDGWVKPSKLLNLNLRCYDQIQQEVFTQYPVKCKRMEKRFCCPSNKEYDRHRRSESELVDHTTIATETTKQILSTASFELPPPSLADINWSPPEDGNLDDDVQTCLWKDRTTSWFSLDTPNNPGKSSNYISPIKIDDEFLIVITMFSRYG